MYHRPNAAETAVVETQPAVIENYNDIMNKDNYTAGFLAGFSDVREFEDASNASTTPGSI